MLDLTVSMWTSGDNVVPKLLAISGTDIDITVVDGTTSGGDVVSPSVPKNVAFDLYYSL